MSGETEIDDPEVSDGASENDYSDHEQELDVIGKEGDNQEMAEQKVRPDGEENGNTVGATATVTKPKFDPKDPLRPRRKKARRACFACQRAHLTCGDERPCQRCIKRGLADACQDGVRKKAKYLHDAPPEALRPVLGPTYNQQVSSNRATAASTPTEPSPGMGNFFSQPDTSPSYPLFGANQQAIADISNFSHSRQSTSWNARNFSTASFKRFSFRIWGGAFFDPSNPALFNFDLEGLNFGNHYGALEFGMLGHMASGSAETPPQDSSAGMPQNVGDLGFSNNSAFTNNPPFNQIYSHDSLPDFAVGLDRPNGGNVFGNNNPHHGLPHAYAIATSGSQHSPSTDASPAASTMGFESSPTTTNYPAPASHRPAKRQDTKSGPSGKLGPSGILGKRNRDPSSIYDTVHEPYSYTTGFHSLTAFIQKRFSPNKTLRIAKSLASIRPSFISCTKTLNRQDLIFMEKCFQRTLFEYEDFMLNCCTPTVVCRRTGEIAAANKEFTLLTGWRKEVLLGNEANLNTNTGSGGPPSSGSSGRGSFTTPRMRPVNLADSNPNGKTQPIFLAELLDDDSVIEFYEDFARLAFGDSRGSVTTRYKLLRYQTAKDTSQSPEGDKGKRKDIVGFNGAGIGGMGNRIKEIDANNGIESLQQDGKVDCSSCWTIKRDVFDIPMLIVMNFLPCI
ncbi:transcription factor [Botrytis cinerea]